MKAKSPNVYLLFRYRLDKTMELYVVNKYNDRLTALDPGQPG